MSKSRSHPRKVNPSAPSLLSTLNSWAQQGLENLSVTNHGSAMQETSSFAEAQKILLDLSQRAIMARIDTSQSGAEMADDAATLDLLHRSLESFIRTQRDFLSLTTNRTLHWLKEVEVGEVPLPVAAMHMARKRAEMFVRLQNAFLDAAARTTSPANAAKGKRFVKSDLAALASQANHAFLQLQEQLLAIAGHKPSEGHTSAQNTKTIRARVSLRGTQEPPSPAFNNLIGAEKALMDAVTCPIKEKKRGRSPRNEIAT
jgi:hypothetical protein